MTNLEKAKFKTLLLEMFPIGTKVKLIKTSSDIPLGSIGTVTEITDACELIVLFGNTFHTIRENEDCEKVG